MESWTLGLDNRENIEVVSDRRHVRDDSGSWLISISERSRLVEIRMLT